MIPSDHSWPSATNLTSIHCAMKIISLPSCLTFALLTATSQPVAADSDAVKTVLITVSDNMKYSVTRIEAQPGQKVHVLLKNVGTLPKEVMAHNWILLKTGQDPSAYAAKAVSAKDQDYQPKSLADEVLAAIPLLGGKQTGEVTFDAPTHAGSFPFLCSFPSHCQVGMRGELVVK